MRASLSRAMTGSPAASIASITSLVLVAADRSTEAVDPSAKVRSICVSGPVPAPPLSSPSGTPRSEPTPSGSSIANPSAVSAATSMPHSPRSAAVSAAPNWVTCKFDVVPPLVSVSRNVSPAVVAVTPMSASLIAVRTSSTVRAADRSISADRPLRSVIRITPGSTPRPPFRLERSSDRSSAPSPPRIDSVPVSPNAAVGDSNRRSDPTSCVDAVCNVRTTCVPGCDWEPPETDTASGLLLVAFVDRNSPESASDRPASCVPTTTAVNSPIAFCCSWSDSVRRTKRSRGRPLICIN